jgi:predicted Zn-ribbon and HTH transcriptional regulator
MACKDCGMNFRTIHLKKGEPMKCYKCGFDNGLKEVDEGTPGLDENGNHRK